TAPAELLFPGEIADLTYLRLLFALADPAVDQIIAPNAWEVWESLRFMEKNWKSLCADIASGKPEHYIEPVSEEFRAVIESRLAPNPERAAELAAIFESGFETPVVPKIWKNISLILAFGDGIFSVYSAGIKRYTGDIPHKNGSYSSATALIGTGTDIPGRYKTAFSNAFVEFLPLEGGSAPAFSHEVKAGCDYSLLISTYSGLYRYKLKEAVHIESVEDGVPAFSYCRDSSLTVQIAGVPFTDKFVSDSVIALRERTGVPVTDYAYKENAKGDGLLVLLEVNNDDISSDCGSRLSAELERIMEESYPACLKAVNAGKLAPVQVAFMEQETQLLYRDIMMNRINRPTDPIKPVRYINSPSKEKFFLSRLIEE
ncbi:MAG: GH3 auxin-responsive promoter family protein, partial [Clostridia bacterium]|nr:GH3 auxin-responsive promoter family protein [Clostridia bacterium]